MGIVVPFRPRSGAWVATERAALLAVQRAFEQHGLLTNCEDGVAEGGSPWRVFYNTMTGQFIAHVARSKGGYVMRCTDRTALQIENIYELVEIARSWIAGCHTMARSG